MQERRQEDISSPGSVRYSAQPPLMASTPASITYCGSVGRGRFCNCMRRPAYRPVRVAPRNWRHPRMRLSEFTQAISFLYLAVLVLVDARRTRSNSLTGSGIFSSASRRSIVERVRSGSLTLYSERMYFSRASRWVAASTSPPVSLRVFSAFSRRRRSERSIAACASSTSIKAPRLLMR